MRRHVQRMHQDREENELAIIPTPAYEPVTLNVPAVDVPEIPIKPSKSILNITEFLQSLQLEQYEELFEKEEIGLNILCLVKSEDIMDMIKEIGIKPWGHRYKIKAGIG